MSDKKAPKKLKLSKVTLRKLSHDTLRDVAGGAGPDTNDVLTPLVDEVTPGCTHRNSCACLESGGAKPSGCC